MLCLLCSNYFQNIIKGLMVLTKGLLVDIKVEIKGSNTLNHCQSKCHTKWVCIDRLFEFFLQQPISSNNGPFSAPPSKTVSPTWQSASRIPARCHSVPSEDSTSPPPEHDPNALYDNYPPIIIGEMLNNRSPGETDMEAPSSPPLPPERKFVPKGDQLTVCFTF